MAEKCLEIPSVTAGHGRHGRGQFIDLRASVTTEPPNSTYVKGAESLKNEFLLASERLREVERRKVGFSLPFKKQKSKGAVLNPLKHGNRW